MVLCGVEVGVAEVLFRGKHFQSAPSSQDADVSSTAVTGTTAVRRVRGAGGLVTGNAGVAFLGLATFRAPVNPSLFARGRARGSIHAWAELDEGEGPKERDSSTGFNQRIKSSQFRGWG